MAKGSLNGVRKGKKGDSVYYTITGSNNKEKQGERQYIGEVANPKTMQQAAQRMKLTPAVNFYRALGNDILNHSWQGVKYGARSHAEFMKLAMNNNSGVFPFVKKGYAKLVPGRYVIAKGSLSPLDAIIDQSEPFTFNAGMVFGDVTNIPVSDYMTNMINASNGVLKPGDQITFVIIARKLIESQAGDYYSDFFTVTLRFVLDPAKDGAGFSTAAAWLASKGVAVNRDGMLVPASNSVLNDCKLASLGVIVSRPSVSKTNGSVSWMRSNASMVVTQDVEEEFFTQNAYDEAIRTYLPENVNPTSGWYLNDGTLNPDNQQTPLAPGVVSYIRNKVVTLRSQEVFGDYALKAVCKNLRKDGIIATTKEPTGDNYAEIQLYSLSDDPSEEGDGTTIYKPAGFVLVAANEDEMAEINEFLGDMISPDEAIAAMAEEGVTYTKGY